MHAATSDCADDPYRSIQPSAFPPLAGYLRATKLSVNILSTLIPRGDNYPILRAAEKYITLWFLCLDMKGLFFVF